MSVKVVNSGGGEVKITVETIPSINVTSPEVGVIDINPNYTTGQPGATGAQGPAGAAGQGVPTGGSQFQILRKVSGTDYDTEWDYADRVTLEVRFDEAVSKGDPLHITGFNNGQNRIAVAKADASDPNKMPAIGLAFADYSQNDNGQATAMGSLDDVNTQVSPNDFQEGEVLYVKAGGGLTNVKPTGTNLIQNVGKVGRRQQNNGEIVVMAIGRSNDVPNIPDGQAWIGNSSGVATPTTLATVATTNSYNDLDDTPTLPAANVDTDLSVSTTSDTVTVISSDGTNATITEATASQAGVMTVNMHDKLEGIAANADATNSTNVDAAGAIMHSDISSNGFIRRTGAETYDQINPGTGLSVSGSDLIVSGNTTLAAENDTDNVILKVTGPSGTQDAGVTLTPSDRLTIEPAGNTVTFTVDNDLANYSNSASQFIKYANLSSAGTAVSGISLTYDDSTGEFDLSGPIALTVGDIPDLSSTYHQDLSEGTHTAAALDINISNGTSVTIPAATSTEAGLLTAANKLIIDEAITDSDFDSNGILRRTGGGAYDADGSLHDLANVTIANSANGHLLIGDASGNFSNQALSLTRITASSTGQNLTLAADEYTGGTGIDVNGSQVISVDTHTTIATNQATDNATITVTGPSGVSDTITLAAGSNVSLVESGDQITIAATNTEYTGGTGITISGSNVISADAAGVDDLNDLSDVTVSSESANDYLVHNGSGAFVNQSLNIVHDDSPELGGNLDVSGNEIVSSSDGNIVINPDGTGNVSLGNFVFDVDQDLTNKNDYVLTYNSTGGLISLEEVTFASNTLTVKAATGAAGFGGRLLFGVDTADQYNGDIVNFGSGPGGTNGNIEKGKLYYLDSSQQWELADANAVASASGMLGIAVVDDSPKFLVRGFARHGTWVSLGTGNPLYISAGATAGEIANSAPSGNGDVVRVIGYSTNSGSREIFFNPSNDWLELT